MKNVIFFMLAVILFSFRLNAQTIWGNNYSRTESRSNASLIGLDGALSGFFETNDPVNFPLGATSWWHLLDVRHSNPSSNYAMQFSGSLYDQDVYFRKTSGNPNQLWTRILTENRGLTLGNVPGNIIEMIRLTSSVGGNASHLSFLNKRNAASNGWQSASTRIQCITDVTNQAYLEFNPPGGSDGLAMGTYVGEVMRLNANGNVGIGIATASEKLCVNGTILSKKVKVIQTGWADYVFHPSYQLAPLYEVETYIKQHQHLPEIPSAAEVEKNGLDLGDNQAALLKKVEELTLYAIQQQKEIDALKAEVRQLITSQGK